MILIEKHAEEIFWLKRRILFLKTMNDLKDNDNIVDIYVKHLTHFESVSEIEKFINRIREIYAEKQKEGYNDNERQKITWNTKDQ